MNGLKSMENKEYFVYWTIWQFCFWKNKWNIQNILPFDLIIFIQLQVIKIMYILSIPQYKHCLSLFEQLVISLSCWRRNHRKCSEWSYLYNTKLSVKMAQLYRSSLVETCFWFRQEFNSSRGFVACALFLFFSCSLRCMNGLVSVVFKTQQLKATEESYKMLAEIWNKVWEQDNWAVCWKTQNNIPLFLFRIPFDRANVCDCCVDSNPNIVIPFL